MIKGLLVVSFVILAMSADADYTDPTTWGGDCDGMRQSPINIETREVEFCPWNVYFGFQAPC